MIKLRIDRKRSLASVQFYLKHLRYEFNESCQQTVPEAIAAFLESHDFEDGIRNAISLGGDSDTLACITGGIAEAFYGGVPSFITQKVMGLLDGYLRSVTSRFSVEYCDPMAQ